jgi:uncharacterized LabA/DUF88 family protein
MPSEPRTKRAVAFLDGQNLFHAVKETWGYRFPNFDPKALSAAVCGAQGWTLAEVRFYTGVPAAERDARWHDFWARKTRALKTEGVYVFTRPLRYSTQEIVIAGDAVQRIVVAQEKGIDVRIAIDIVSMARRGEYDVALVFSQDQDLSEVAHEIRAISREKGRWLKIASAFPCEANTRNRRGIDKTDWVRIDRATYDACIDRRDYRGTPQP